MKSSSFLCMQQSFLLSVVCIPALKLFFFFLLAFGYVNIMLCSEILILSQLARPLLSTWKILWILLGSASLQAITCHRWVKFSRGKVWRSLIRRKDSIYPVKHSVNVIPFTHFMKFMYMLLYDSSSGFTSQKCQACLLQNLHAT